MSNTITEAVELERSEDAIHRGLDNLTTLTQDNLSKLTEFEDVLGECYFQLNGILAKLNTEGGPMAANQQSAQISPEMLQQLTQSLSNGSSQSNQLVDMKAIENMIDKKFDSSVDAIVGQVLTAQEEGKSFWTSPIFIGGVAVAAIIAIGGTLYLFNKRLKTLEEIQAAK